MAGRLLKENIRLDRLIGQGSGHAAAETAVMLGGENGVRVVRAAAQPVITAKESQTGGVAVQGTAEFDVMYLTQDGAAHSRRAQAGFHAVIPMEGAAPGQQAQVMASAEGVQAVERDGRLELSAQILLTGMAIASAEVPVAMGVAAQEETAQRFEQMRALYIAQRAQMRQTIADTVPLAHEGMTHVVWQHAKPVVQHVLPMDGAVEISGMVEMDCLLAGETAGDLAWQCVSLPYSVELAGDNFEGDMRLRTTARVRDADAHMLQTASGEDETMALHAECVLELEAEGIAMQEKNVLMDAYPLSDEPFEATLALVDFFDDLDEEEQEQTVEATLELPPDAPPIRSIVGTFAAPIMLETTGGDETRAEGLLRVTLLYRTDGQEGLEIYEQEVPFGVTFDRIGSLGQVWRIEIGQAEAQRMTPLQAQVRVQVELEDLQVLPAQANVVQEISYDGEPVQPVSGITLYYPEAKETLWDVAKRFRISEEALKVRNPDGKAPLMIYRRLTAF